ncbi:hypothetical protein SBC1_42810 (plasmid) [Caballeronia sp. SBC1]|nr:hypothetical protein SBC2_45120 [Caballeronia sp. SBC2]QIN64241.1 hypothetical protein SBC1_42810 [Caballeronia sp. SBC1]
MGRTHYYAPQASGEGPVELGAGPRKVLIARAALKRGNSGSRNNPRTTMTLAKPHKPHHAVMRTKAVQRGRLTSVAGLLGACPTWKPGA